MRYLALLLYGPDVEELTPGTPEFDADLARYERFNELAGDAVVGGAALDHKRTAVTVRHTDRGPLITDGPFAETAEVVGGIYVLEAATLDDAVELARHIPAAEDGAVELRPLVQWDDRSAEEGAVPPGATRYLALLAGKENEASLPGTAAWDEAAAEHGRFAAEVGEALLGGAALHPAATATTVRVRDGEVLLTDGPYAETAEVIGGLYLLAAAGREEAVALAQRIPSGPDSARNARSRPWPASSATCRSRRTRCRRRS
jgi:hypothetical protein